MRMNLKLAQDVRTLRPHLSDTERERIREDVEQLLSGKGSFPILDALPSFGASEHSDAACDFLSLYDVDYQCRSSEMLYDVMIQRGEVEHVLRLIAARDANPDNPHPLEVM